MTTQFWASTIKRLALSLFVAFLAGAAFNFATSDSFDRSPFVAGAVTVGIYIALSLLLGLLNAVSGALYLWIFANSDMTEAVLAELRSARITPPADHDLKTTEYLLELADNPDALPDERVKGAAFAAAYKTAQAHLGIFKGLAFRRAADAAVLRYYHEAPRQRQQS